MLIHAIRHADLPNTLLPKAAYQPFAQWQERSAWLSLSTEVQAYYRNAGETLRGKAWVVLPAAQYMDFVRSGNRVQYESHYFQRRDALFALTIAECLDGNKRYLDDIINGLWAICEETTWVLPAHNNPFAQHDQPGMNALADPETRPNIDLFAAETASLLAWMLYLLKAPLDAESPIIARRVTSEINRRVLDPYLAFSDFHWMGIDSQEPVNNWNPWINSNILATALILSEDAQTRIRIFEKCGLSAQRFLDRYAPDGGCDEGPAYFSVAGASMMDLLELMYESTHGAVNLYAEPLIRNIPRYIMAMHIAGPYHVNFADAAARIEPDALFLFRTGKAIQDDALIAYAKSLLHAGYAEKPYNRRVNQVYRMFQNLFLYNPSAYTDVPEAESYQCFFPGIQVMTAREISNSEKGLYLAAKGGTNAESHNHNDIGNYILYLDGQPCLCDAGVETYSRKTFSSLRYELWTMQSGYHNTAKVNGFDQCPGDAFHAESVHYTDGENPSLSMDIAKAYPPEAHIDRYGRSMTLNRTLRTVEIRDTITLSQCLQPTVLPLLSAVMPEIADHEIIFPVSHAALRLSLPPGSFIPSLETIDLSDERLQQAWKRPCLYRILLTRAQCRAHDSFVLTFHRD